MIVHRRTRPVDGQAASADPGPFGVGLTAFRAILMSVPQVLIASVGGLVGRQVVSQLLATDPKSVR